MQSVSFVNQVIKAYSAPSILLRADAPFFTIEMINKALLEVSQRPSEQDLIGKGIFEAFPDNPNDLQADGMLNLKNSLLQVVQTGIIQEMPPQKYDIALPNSNQFETRYWQVKNVPIFNDDGKVTHILHTTEDITDKILLEKKAQELEILDAQKKIILEHSQSNLDTGSWHLDLKTNLFFWSPELFKICGFTNNAFEPSLNKALEIIHPEDIEKVRTAYKSTIENGHPWHIEFRIIKPDGIVILVLVSGVAIKNNDGQTVKLTGLLQNITSSKQLETMLRQTVSNLMASETRYRKLFENNPSPMFIWDFKTLQIIDCNEEALSLYGYSKEELLSLTIRDIRPEEDISLIEELTKSEESYGQVHKKVWRHKKKNGDIIFVYIVGHLFENNGRKVSLVSLNDVTEKIKIEQALQASETKYKSFFNNSLDANLLSIENGRILAANPVACDMFGYTEDELCTLTRQDIADVTDKRLIELLNNKNLTGHGEAIHRFFKKNGQIFEAYVSSTVYSDVNGEVRNAVIIKDLDEKLKAEKALKDSEARYRSLFENALDATILATSDGQIFAANPAAYKMFQYTQAEFLTINKEAILDQNDPRFEKLLAAFILTNRMHGQLRCKKKNGQYFEGEVSATVYLDRDNNKISSIIIKDITEKLKADIKIKQSEIIYKSIFENSMDSVLLTLPSGEILAANPAACQLFGVTELELITVGRKGIVDYKDPELPKLMYQRSQNGLTLGKLTYIKKDGTKFIGETSSAIFLDAHNVSKSIVTIRDISEKIKAEQALKDSESRYKSFFENGINANFICHPNGDIIVANQKACEMFGYSVAELCQMNRAQLADMQDPRLIKLIQEKETNGNAGGIHRMFHKNGHAFEAYISSKIYFDSNGERHAIIIKDISEQQRAERALVESEKKYRLLFYNSPMPKWIYEESSLKILDVNEAAINHYGYSRKEFLNLTILALRPEDEVPKLKTIINNKNRPKGLYKAGVFIHKKKNGQLISVEISSIPIDYEGKKCKLIIANDVTDIEYALKELAISIERYNYVTKATSDAIWDWDLTSSKAIWGEGFESIFGYKVSDVNTDISFLVNNIHSDDKQRINDEFYKIIKSDLKQWKEEYRFKKADGSYAYVINKVFLIRDTNQRVIRIVGGMRDITEQKEHVTEIIKAIIKTQEDERLEIGSELHDNICQILATCKISFKMLEKNIADSDKAWFEQGIDQINLVFKEVRNLSHRLAPNFFKDDTLEDSLKKLVGTFNIEGQYNITFAFDDNFKSHSISREFQLNIYRILQEQMRNILKYAEGKNIEISGKCTTSSLQLIIKDDGIGFNPDNIKSGIGLANMKRRAELFGGRLFIDSAIGKGCCITVDIPLTEIN